MFTQENAYGCGMYAVANACNLSNYVTPDRLEASKVGNNIGHLSNWLQEDGTGMYMEVAFFSMFADKLPKEVCELKPEGEVLALPVVIACQLSKGGLSHMMGGHILKDGSLTLMDSLKKDIQITTLLEINQRYFRVYGLYIFADVHTADYAFIS